jgi:hypothetical protein
MAAYILSKSFPVLTEVARSAVAVELLGSEELLWDARTFCLRIF